MSRKKLRIAVIFGGRSGEHEVSIMSAASIIAAIPKDKYEVIPVGITKEGRWLVGGDPMAALTGGRLALPALTAGGSGTADESRTEGEGRSAGESRGGAEIASATVLPLPGERRLVSVESGGALKNVAPFDVVFPVLHGTYGEDGTIQGLLELADIPYIGAGVAGSAVGMDKALMKAIFRAAGLPVADFLVIKRHEVEETPQMVRQKVEEHLGYPCFVKPANLGSSVGVSKVRQAAELQSALLEAAAYDRKLVVEKAVSDALEVEVSVLGNDEPKASIPGEIVPANEFYDYNAKYRDDSQLFIPARLSPACTQKVRDMAIQAFLACDCAGMARVDFFVSKKDESVLVNEINTIPGFTRISMYPKLWEASGLPYPELIERLIELALERHQEKQRSKTSYDWS